MGLEITVSPHLVFRVDLALVILAQNPSGCSSLLSLLQTCPSPLISIYNCRANLVLVVNKALPEFDFAILKEKVQETSQLPVAGVLPLSTEMLRLGSQGLFCLNHPAHSLTQEL